MYTTINFKSKKELKAAVAAWNDWIINANDHPAIGESDVSRPQPVRYFQPGPFGGNEPKNGTIYIEGPHYPAPHRWYAQCVAENGIIIKVK